MFILLVPITLNRRQELHVELKETILRAERVLLHRLGFDFNVEHPYKHLLSVIKRMSQAGLIEEESTKTLAQVSWNFANDRYEKSARDIITFLTNAQVYEHHYALSIVQTI
jgi:hypothetical protein